MSVDTNPAATGAPAGDELAGIDAVTLTIDGFEVSVPKGTLVIRAAERLGIQIPRFCEHPLLDPIGACRQCLVDVEGQRKPMASCTTVATDGMVVKTQYTSPVAEKAQKGIIEFLLINHPLDCPVCDKGGECPLQNQTMTNGYEESRFHDPKRTYPKPIAISSQVLLDRERCILCTRCTRFAQQVAGDPFIEMLERGALQQVAIYEDKPFESYFSGNTIQICPVGALTGSQYRFRSRPFDLVSSPSICEHCAAGCQQRNDHRRNKTMRRLAGVDPQVNEEWNCDKGRWAFNYLHAADRLRAPLVREDDGTQVPTSWPDALDVAASGLAGKRGRAAVLTGGRLTVEDAYAYAKFARVALGTNDVDMRARPSSQEEADFLAAHVAGRFLDVTYADLEAAPAVLLVGFEAEEEAPIVFLRLRKNAWKHRADGGGTAVFSLAAFETNGLAKLSGTLLPTIPGGEAAILDALVATGSTEVPAGLDADAFGRARELLRLPGAVILVGERAAASPGALSAAMRLATTSGARLAWIPRRAGERGALEAGAMPGLLPGGRPITDTAARSAVGALWACDIPATPGRDTEAILRAAKAGELDALVIAGVDPDDLPDPRVAREAIEAVPFVVSLELRASWVTAHADVVLPVAAAAEKAGTFLDWEGRSRPFDVSLRASGQLLDLQVLTALADSMDVHVGLPDVLTARAELASLGVWDADRPAFAQVTAGKPAHAGQGEAVLATWHHLLDQGRMQDDSPYLAGTAKVAVARLSAATAAEIGATDGAAITVSTPRGRISLPLVVTPMPDRVVWLPTNSAGCNVRRDLAALAGDVVRISAGGTVTAGGQTASSNADTQRADDPHGADTQGQEGAA